MRDHSQTGAMSGTSGAWINIDTKMGVFKLPNNTQEGVLAFYLDTPFMEWKPGVDDIPDHWEVVLPIECDLGTGPAKYNLSLSHHWRNPLLSNVINALLGQAQDPVWMDPDKRLFVISLSMKTTDSGRPQCGAFCDIDRNRTKAKMKFPWNEGLRKFESIPEFEYTTPGGRQEIADFWLAQSALLVGLFGGTINYKGANIAPPTTDSDAEAWVKNIAAGNAAPTTAGQPAKQMTAQPEVTKVDRAKAWWNDQVTKGNDATVIVAALKAAAPKVGLDATETKVLVAWVNARLATMLPGFSMDTEYNLSANTDDLPF